jgi:para-aminobenzoate synthetase component I
LFEPLAGRPWAMWLDSGHPQLEGPGIDLMVAEPRMTLVARGDHIRIEAQGEAPRTVQGAPLDVLRHALGPVQPETLAGGAVGYFAYDLARQWQPLAAPAGDSEEHDSEQMPDMAVGIFDGFVVIDHRQKTCQIRAQDTVSGRDWARRMARVLAGPRPGPLPAFYIAGDVQASFTRAGYGEAFRRVQAYIHAGDCYQINLAIRFAVGYQGHPWHAYKRLRSLNPAPYAAWLNFPFAQVLSSSPEGFLEVEGEGVITRPIKGTRPRGSNALEDDSLATELAGNPKDRAENLMIVDLLRNDLGKVCALGSVRVPELFRVERFATVMHLVSQVEGRLAPGQGAIDLLAAAFPGGSITGAPKRRAMEIIADLEPHRRGLYCGAIGHVDFNGDMNLNIAIRTLVCAGGQARFWAGGGLVADSGEEAEYRECLDKARALHALLEGFHAVQPDAAPGS